MTLSTIATCSEKLPEVSEDGVGEEATRSVTWTVYFCEHRYLYDWRRIMFNKFAMIPGGEEIVSDTPATARFLLIIQL